MILKLLSWFEKNNKFSRIITLIGAILIFYISSLSFGQAEYCFGIWTIIYHFSAFFCFGFFLFVSLVQGKNKGFFIVGILIALSYAILDELHQLFVPGRFCTVSDFVTDSVGIIFSFLLYYILVLIREK